MVFEIQRLSSFSIQSQPAVSQVRADGIPPLTPKSVEHQAAMSDQALDERVCPLDCRLHPSWSALQIELIVAALTLFVHSVLLIVLFAQVRTAVTVLHTSSTLRTVDDGGPVDANARGYPTRCGCFRLHQKLAHIADVP